MHSHSHFPFLRFPRVFPFFPFFRFSRFRPFLRFRPNSWNNLFMKLLLLLGAAVALIGCGKSEVVTIGEPGEKGTYRREIDKSKDIAGQASEKIKEGNKEAFDK